MNYNAYSVNLWAAATTERQAPQPDANSSFERRSASGRVLAHRWTLSKTLGVGGTGTVYEAKHRNGRRVAVKVLHPELSHHATIRKRFSSEGYAANRVRHPDAVAVLDDGEEADGTAFLVMELLEGRSLAKVLSDRGALPEAEVIAVAIATLEVLAAAHDNGVIHRDVKPGNIFATLDGRIKLLDFGVAQVADLSSNVITQTGGTVGTPAFMAPEQAAGKEIDALTDIWAVGATMFQLLTQRVVHSALSNNGTIVTAATVPAPLIRSVAPHISPQIAQVIDRALSFDRLERWTNARAMQLALRNACPDLARVTSSEPSSHETLPEENAEPARLEAAPSPIRLTGRLGVLIALPLLLAVLSAWMLRTHAGSVAIVHSPRVADAVTQPPTSAFVSSSPQIPVERSASTGAEALDAAPRPSALPNGRKVSVIRSLARGSSRAATQVPPTESALLDRRK